MSDFLAQKQIPIVDEYSAENLKGSTWGIEKDRPDMVIVGNAISKGHVEASIVEDWVQDGYKRLSFPQALAEFAIQDKQSIVVAGTHGKTTTASIGAHALDVLGHEPGFFIGGIPLNFGYGCRSGAGNVFISEGDEYDTAYWDKVSKFLHYKPSWVLCTGIEFDHADIFKDLAAVEDSFLKLVDLTSEGWVGLVPEESPSPASMSKCVERAKARNLPLINYGFTKGADMRIESFEASRLPWDKDCVGTKIQVAYKNKSHEFYSPMSGKHNALNMVGILATFLGAGRLNSLDQTKDLFKNFKGIKRRQEEKIRINDLIVIDDFAHHPSAIKETIAAIKMKFPDHQVAAFFEPRSATSARNIFFDEFKGAFEQADAVFLSLPTKDNVPLDERLDVVGIVKYLVESSHFKGAAFYSKQVEELISTFENWREAHKNKTVALVMSNGPFGGLIPKLIDKEQHG